MDMPTSDARKSMTQMLTIANHVWFAALGFKLTRDGTSKRTAGKKRDFAYTVHFHDLIEWTSCEKPAKPALPQWNVNPPELDEKDILLTKMVRGKRHIQVSESFLPSKKARHNKIAGLQDEDMTGRDGITERGYCPVLQQDLIVLPSQNTKRRRLMLLKQREIWKREEQEREKVQDVKPARGWADECREEIWKAASPSGAICKKKSRRKKRANIRKQPVAQPSQDCIDWNQNTGHGRQMLPNQQEICERDEQEREKESDVTFARGWADKRRAEIWKASQAPMCKTRSRTKKKAKTRTQPAAQPSEDCIEWMLAQKALLSQTRSLTPNADGCSLSRYWSGR